MKTISHPSPQFESYNKVLQFANFPICFCFAVENLWITALMISYQTPNIADAFIWILPVLICILVRPFLISYVHKVISSRIAELMLIQCLMFGIVIGCLTISFSSDFSSNVYALLSKFTRIIMCTLGWTIMDVCCDLCLFFSDKTKIRLQKLGYQQNQMENNLWSILGYFLGYGFSFVVCLLKGGKTMKKFYTCSYYIYLICAIVSGIYWMSLYLTSRDKYSILHETKQLITQSRPAPKNIAYFLPGFHEVRKSFGLDRWLLLLHFIYLFALDTFLIYASMWIIMVYQQQGIKQGSSYNLGMKEGCLAFLMFKTASFVNLLGSFTKNQGLHKKINYFITILVAICIAQIILFIKLYYISIFVIAFLMGTADGHYRSQIQPNLISDNPVFQSSTYIVDRMQKLFILCPMPFFIMIILKRDDIGDSLLWLPISTIVLMILANYWKDASTNKIKKL